MSRARKKEFEGRLSIWKPRGQPLALTGKETSDDVMKSLMADFIDDVTRVAALIRHYNIELKFPNREARPFGLLAVDLIVAMAQDLRVPCFVTQPRGRKKILTLDKQRALVSAVKIQQLRRDGCTIDQACEDLVGTELYRGYSPDSLATRYREALLAIDRDVEATGRRGLMPRQRRSSPRKSK